MHVTLRVVDGLGSLRSRGCYAAIREAAITLLPHEDCRITQLSIQGTHLHLLVEADGKRALAKGMQAFKISAAKHINAAVSRAGTWWERRRMTSPPKRRKGSVFADRYHMRVITSPLQARRELAYVINNWRKHGEDRRGAARTWLVDPFSTGWSFAGWAERVDEPFVWKVRDTYDPIPVYGARTWLLKQGWRRHASSAFTRCRVGRWRRRSCARATPPSVSDSACWRARCAIDCATARPYTIAQQALRALRRGRQYPPRRMARWLG